MKNFLWLVILVVLLVSMVLSGCSSPGPSPAQAPSPSVPAAPAAAVSPAPGSTSAPAPAPASAKTYKFSVAISTPAQGWVSANGLRPFLKQITDATKGAVQFDVFYDQTLCKQNQTWQAVQNDVADVAQVVHSSFPGLTPVNEINTLPFLCLDTAKKNSTVYWKMYEKFPAVQNEFKPNHVLAVWAASPSFVTTLKKEIKTMEDFKGLRLKQGGGLPVTQAFQALGIAPITMAAADTYMNVQKGVVDGGTNNWDMFNSFKLYEVSKYYTYANFYDAYQSLIMNTDKWNSLPKDVQDQINGVCGLSASQFWGTNQFDAAEGPTREEIKKAGYTMIEYTLPQKEMDKILAVGGQPIWDRWVKDMTAKGVPDAQKMLDSFIQLQKDNQ